MAAKENHMGSFFHVSLHEICCKSTFELREIIISSSITRTNQRINNLNAKDKFYTSFSVFILQIKKLEEC